MERKKGVIDAHRGKGVKGRKGSITGPLKTNLKKTGI
jgi:hypothetical protein